LTFPHHDNERNMTKLQYPGINQEEVYSERTEIGYRWYAAHPETKPRLPFGFGLSYADIRFLGSSFHREKTNDLVFHIGLINTSDRPGITVPQIYITKYPAEALKIVAPIALVGFKRVELKAYDFRPVTIRVSKQSLSVWTSEKQDYYLFPGEYELSIGSSYVDFWKKVAFTVR